MPFFNDAPWGRATTKDAHECKRKYNIKFGITFKIIKTKYMFTTVYLYTHIVNINEKRISLKNYYFI